MKYKIGDSFLMPAEIIRIVADSPVPYLISGVSDTGWWSEEALEDIERMACADCRWKGKRHQKCSCCIRNRGDEGQL